MRRIGPYEVETELGRGGMGVVLRARDPALRRSVAIKLVTGIDARRKARFAREAEALAKLEHPNIVRLFHAGEEAGQPYLVMELIDGEDLETRLGREGPLPIAEAVELTRTLAAALQHAHERGVLHRDLKPANVLVDRSGRPLLTDFGLALDLDPDRSRLSRSGNSMGSPGFWPPEQARGLREAGPTNDVYGLGATLYALLTGSPPFVAESMHELVAAMTKPPAPPSHLRPDVPGELDAVVLRCLATNPEDRFPTIAAVAAALPKPRRAPSVRAAKLSTPPSAARGVSRREVAGLAVLGVVTLVAAWQAMAGHAAEDARATAARRADAVSAELETVRAEEKRTAARVREAEARVRGAEERARETEERARETEERAVEAEGRAQQAEKEHQQLLRLMASTEDPLVRADREREMVAARALPAASDPAGAAAAFERALVRHRVNDTQGAVPIYTEALQLDPRHARAYRNRGNARAVYSDHAAARRDYGLAIGLGELARARGETEGLLELAAALYSRAEQANGTEGFTDYPGAVRDYTRALALHPDYYMALRGRGDVLLELGEPAKALVDLQRALALTPPDQLTARSSIERNLPRARAAIAAGQ